MKLKIFNFLIYILQIKNDLKFFNLILMRFTKLILFINVKDE